MNARNEHKMKNARKDILTMYHTKQINQVKRKEKSLLFKSFSQNNLQIDFTPSQQDLYDFFLKYPNVYMTNEQLALKIGRTTRTIIRATNKFHKYGLVTKHQKDDYSPNYYTVKKNTYTFSHWMNRLSSPNQYFYNTHGIRIDHKNRIIYSPRNVTPKRSSLILDNLFINLSSTLTREKRFFKKITEGQRWNPQKGMNMYNFQDKPFVIAKPKEKKRNPGGHSPAVLKPALPLKDQITELDNDIKSLSERIEFNTGPSYMISYAMNVVEHKIKELRQLKAQYELEESNKKNSRSNDEKQGILYRYGSDSLAAYSS